MPAAISSLYKTSIALAGGVIAVSPLIPSQEARIASVHLPEIQLTDLTVPALGASPTRSASICSAASSPRDRS